MNWDAIGAVGELLGATVVVITLIYLAAQVRHAREDVRRSINHSRSEINRNLLLTRTTNEILRNSHIKAFLNLGGELPVFVKTVIDKAGLTDEEAVVIYWEQLAWWQYRVEIFANVEELTEIQRSDFEQGIRESYGNSGRPVERMFYNCTKASLSPDIVRYVEDVIAGQPMA